MIYFCCDRRRRNAVRGSPLNGIDFVEVLDRDAATDADRQRFLFVHLLNPLGGTLTPDNIHFEGGERIRDIDVLDVVPPGPSAPNVFTVEVDTPGDFSVYTMRIVRGALDLRPPEDFDPRLAAVDFSFKVECPSDFDCKPSRVCTQAPALAPDIDYLAKDYASFRRLMLDRMALLTPQWRERNAADVGIALVELLSYVGDHLSYEQDAIGTEAYLNTARRRVSVRRHARLVDYFMSEGSNARTWIYIQVDADNVAVPRQTAAGPTKLLTGVSNQGVTIAPDTPAYRDALREGPVVFELMHDVVLFQGHNAMPLYTWGDRECCLPRDALTATLHGHYPDLQPGDVLVFEEVKGPRTGQPEDADVSRRQAVRLVEVVHSDESDNPLTDPLNAEEITEIRWAEEDALRDPFCVSSRTDAEHGRSYVDDVSIARGNIVLADHGLTIEDESLGTFPDPIAHRTVPPGTDRCEEPRRLPVYPRFRPVLARSPVTHAAPLGTPDSATEAMRWSNRRVVPAATLRGELNAASATWYPKRDLLNSAAAAREFVLEIEAKGQASIRFGDDHHGARPEPGTVFTATYRVGNGASGNIGADALRHIVTGTANIVGVRNVLPARGGTEPETADDVRQRAPSAFRTQQRAVTPDDYAAVTERHSDAQKAAATFRWTGSWYTVFLTVDRLGGAAVSTEFERDIRRHVERYRMAGYDLEVDTPQFVPLEIEMNVCVEPDYFRSDVKAALLQVFSNRLLPDGRRGVFHPDNFTFGQTVYLSPLYAAAQAVPGVQSVHITAFHRQGTPEQQPLLDGKLTVDRLEIARLDNDPNFIERGVFTLNVAGGK